MDQAVFEALAQAARTGEPVSMGVICGTKGSSPQKLGAKALFHADGRITGTLGGGCLEAEVQRRALQTISTGQPARFDLLLDHDFGWDDGLICGGKVCGVIVPKAERAGELFWRGLSTRAEAISWGIREDFSIQRLSGDSLATDLQETGWLYRETVTPPCALWIAGAGHIAQAVAPLAVQVEFDVTVFDDRPALVNPHFFPARGVTLKADDWEVLLSTPAPRKPAFGLIVTRGHRHDALVLRDWIRKSFLFVGMIGSSRKARIIFDHFAEERIASAEQLKRVTCPVGLAIGSRTVPEIAVSIVAQMIEKRAQLVGAPLIVGSDCGGR